MRGDLLSVNGNRRRSQFQYSTQKSLSDTEINKYGQVSSCSNRTDMPETGKLTSLLLMVQLYHGPSLPNLFNKAKDSDQEESSTGAEEEPSFGSEYSGGKRVGR